MARTFRRKERLSALSEINVTPLIDLAFALLIIFMITTPLFEQAIEIDLPAESQKPQQDKKDTKFQLISIDPGGDYYWGKKQVDLDELHLLLSNLALETLPPVIEIRADSRLPYQNVITLIDLIKQNNLTQISLDTKVK